MSKLVRRTGLVLAMVASLTLAAPVIAGAKTPPPITTMQQYRAALHTYQQAKDAIDLALHQSIESDKAGEIVAMAAAKTEAQKYLARVDFNEARATDVANWQTALINLGPAPLPPGSSPATTTISTTITLSPLHLPNQTSQRDSSATAPTH